MVAHTPKQVRVYSHTIWIGGLQPPKRNKNKQEHGKTTIKDKQQNWEARSRHGMFAGYKMKNGYEWTNMNEVWDLDAFRNANLKADVDFAQLKRVRPHIVRRIRAPPGNEIQFPLLKAYLEINDTLEGHRAAKARDESFAADANEVFGEMRRAIRIKHLLEMRSLQIWMLPQTFWLTWSANDSTKPKTTFTRSGTLTRKQFNQGEYSEWDKACIGFRLAGRAS